MATKRAKSTKHGASETNLAAAVKQSAHQIWMAGLGAFAKAQEERGKVFHTLVREGSAIQKRTMALTEDKMNEVTNRVSQVTDRVVKVAGQVQKEANDRWDKLEGVFEARVERALRRLGVPTTKDLHALQKRLDAVTAKAKKAAPAKPVRKSVRKAVKSVKSAAKTATKAVTKAVNNAS